MKIVLVLSLILNFVFAYFLVGKKETTPVMERVIIETHSEPRRVEIKEARGHVVEELKKAPTPTPSAQKEKEQESQTNFPIAAIGDINDVEVMDAGERMERRRMDFLTNELNLSEEVLQKMNQLKSAYYQKQNQYWEKNKTMEPSFDQRREMIDMEEKLYQDMEQVLGKRNWERYQQFRQRHNARGFKERRGTNDPFIFMGI